MHPTIRTKLMLLGGLAVTVALCLAFIGHQAIRSFTEASQAATVLIEALRHQQHADMMHDALRGDVLRVLAITEDGKPEAKVVQETQEELEQHALDFSRAMAANAKLDLPPAITTAITGITPKVEAYILGARSEMNQTFQDRRVGKASYPEFQEAFGDLEKPMGDLSELIQQTYLERQKEATAAGNRARTLILLSAVVAGVLMVGLSAAIGRSITRPLNLLREGMERIAQGDADLTRRINLPGDDELAQTARAFNQFAESLSALISRLQVIAHRVADGASQIAEGNAGLQDRTERQAASLEETSSSMIQINEIVSQTAQLARAAAHSTEQTRRVTESGQATATLLLERMDAVQASSSRIADIIGVVDEIAFQTNLLALNAAVEAARAGEQGRGFAVVASEVRSLALRSSQAAKEIKGLIQESVLITREGAQVASATGTTMANILKEMGGVTHQIHEIAHATQSQQSSIQEASQAIAAMERGTQQNAAMVEEAAAASLGLDEEAQSLTQEVGRFRTGHGDPVTTVRSGRKTLGLKR